MLRQRADIVCLQETKAHREQLDATITRVGKFNAFFNDAEKKGYSGVAIYTRHTPDRIGTSAQLVDLNTEGRFLQVDFGKLSVVSLYLPSGSSGEVRQAVKFDVLERFMPVLEKMRRQRREFILCGDWNIAHQAIDLKNWRSNQKNSGFLPEERAWLSDLFQRVGFVDAFRVVNQAPEQYTWWSNRGRAWEKNVGWRIDYQIVSPGLRGRIQKATIHKKTRFSDHAPLIMDYVWEL